MEPVKHTPGPWKITDFTDPDNGEVRRSAFVNCAAPGEYPWSIASPMGQSDDNRVANARLIAAAPDLLEAAKIALDSLRAWNEMNVPPHVRKQIAEIYESSPEIGGLVAAIQKAEGGK